MNSQKGYEPFGNKILKHSEYFGSAPLRSDFAKMVVLKFTRTTNHTQTRWQQLDSNPKLDYEHTIPDFFIVNLLQYLFSKFNLEKFIYLSNKS